MAEHSTYPLNLTQISNKVDSPGGTVYIEFNNSSGLFLELLFDGEDGWLWEANAIRYFSAQSSILDALSLDANGFGEESVPSYLEDHIVLAPVLTDWQNPTIRRDFEYSADLSTMYTVQFMNQHEATDIGGELVLDGTDIITSGDSRFFQTTDPHNITAPERFASSPTLKHITWRNVPEEHFLTDTFIPATFLQQFAQFDELHSAEIYNDLISAGNSSGWNGSTIEFHDPWYLQSNGSQPDAFLTFNSPYEPTGAESEAEGGVFIDRIPDPINPEFPFYSLKVPATRNISFHGKNITWTFQSWRGEEVEFEDEFQPETAAIFRDNDAQVHIEARAGYKGHFVADKDVALGPNGSRKLAEDSNGDLHLVYEDGENIWYTTSTDNGLNWSTEANLSYFPEEYGLTNLHPSILIRDDIIYVAYTSLFSQGSFYNIYLLEKDINQSTWSTGISVSDGSYTTFAPQSRLAARTYHQFNYLMLAELEKASPAAFEITTHFHDLNTTVWQQAATVITGQNPSLSSHAPAYNELAIAYQVGDEIYSRRWNPVINDWREAVRLSGNTWWGTGHNAPSLSVYNNKGYVTWQAIDDAFPGQKAIYFASFTVGDEPDPGDLTLFPGTNVKNPVVSAWGVDKATIFFEENGQILKRVLNNGTWTGQSLSDGQSPTVLAQGHSGLYAQDAGEGHFLPGQLDLGQLADERGVFALSGDWPHVTISDIIMHPDSMAANRLLPAITNHVTTEALGDTSIEYSLLQNYPNPFNPETVIRFSLPVDQLVRLDIYDIAGRKIKSAINDQRSAGIHEYIWDGNNEKGIKVASGLYIYRLVTGIFTQSRKMLLIE